MLKKALPEESGSVQQYRGRNLLLVTGPGRSGTSALTGMLSRLGAHVPGPLVAANRSNQRGFYETRWVVDFQRTLLSKAYTYEFDGDPRSCLRVAEVVDQAAQNELDQWLKQAMTAQPLVAIKDPRTIWLHDLWVRAAQSVNCRVSYVTTLRHPAEVVGSRTEYYSTETRAIQAREYQVAKVAGWIHVSLLNERDTRNQPRAYVRYDQLVHDWRPIAAHIEDQLELRFPARPEPWGTPHAVDDFLSTDLHRVTTGWDDLDCPDSLRDIAEQTWRASLHLAAEGRSKVTDVEFDHLMQQYSELYRDSAAIAADMTTTRVNRATASTERTVRAEYRSPTDVQGMRRLRRLASRRGVPAAVRRVIPARVKQTLRRRISRERKTS